MGVQEVRMTLRIGRNNLRQTRSRLRAFTLIELILVLGLLAFVMAASAPSLSRFFGGRNLIEESRRFLALTEHGRNQAISEGIPMRLWMDIKGRQYGLKPEIGYPTNRFNSFHYHLREGIRLEIEASAVSRGFVKSPSILFLPDGSISENSLYEILLKDRRGQRRIAPSSHRLNFELRDPHDLPITSRL